MTTLVFCLKKNTHTLTAAWTETGFGPGAPQPAQLAIWPKASAPEPARQKPPISRPLRAALARLLSLPLPGGPRSSARPQPPACPARMSPPPRSRNRRAKPSRITLIRRPRALCPRLYNGQDPLCRSRHLVSPHNTRSRRPPALDLAGAGASLPE